MAGRANPHINKGAKNPSTIFDPKITAVSTGLKYPHDGTAFGTKKGWSAQAFHPLIWCVPTFAGPNVLTAAGPSGSAPCD